MKNNLFLALFVSVTTLTLKGQSDTHVYLASLGKVPGNIELANLKNISNNEGYNNQPAFYNEHNILFSSTRNSQTDIALYNVKTATTTWISNTAEGSEYSPLKVPNKEAISAIRLDTNGLQRLYQYDLKTGASEMLLQDLKVGYHVWHNEETLVCTVLIDDRMDLVVANLRDKTNYTVEKYVGRSLHNIPNTNLVSYISKDKDAWSIKSLDPVSGTTKVIAELPKGSEDIGWLADGTLLIPSGNLILQENHASKDKPGVIDLSSYHEINVISRIAVSPDGKHLALVTTDPPSKVVQKQVDSYNAGDLDAFINCYSENVVVSYYPADTWYEGHERMREIYAGLSPTSKTFEVEVVKRISIGNKVIDHEKVTGNGKIQMQVAVYEVNNGAISSMTFIFDEATSDPEKIVQEQLDAYNARDIDGFLNTYTEDVQLFNFPQEKRSQGQAEMRNNYARFFESTPDLHCEIKNRMVIGNKVIDEEFITANGKNFSAVAIYEVENDKIAKVTFLR